MCNFLENGLQLQRIHLFHFACDHHADNPDDMEPCRMQLLNFLLEITVHQLHTRKVGFVGELV